ncbi:hypothetical protein RUM44_012953 [Polyplax serrata]|uniref:Mediator of DNA damage checkpoint protein 1 n=1 Tax=Polyplax serrata TaxID=468196 RepID=A0ABR1BGR6_POLSC
MQDTQLLSQETIASSEESKSSEPVGFIVLGHDKYEIKRGCNKVGRDPEQCSVILNNSSVSKLHCVIESDGSDDTFIYDAGSTNKTKLGKKYIKPHCRYKLDDGASITLGSEIVTFVTFKPERCQQPTFIRNINTNNLGETSSKCNDIYNLETQVNIPISKCTRCDHISGMDFKSVFPMKQMLNLGNNFEYSNNFNLETQCQIQSKINKNKIYSITIEEANDQLSIFEKTTQVRPCTLFEMAPNRSLTSNIQPSDEGQRPTLVETNSQYLGEIENKILQKTTESLRIKDEELNFGEKLDFPSIQGISTNLDLVKNQQNEAELKVPNFCKSSVIKNENSNIKDILCLPEMSYCVDEKPNTNIMSNLPLENANAQLIVNNSKEEFKSIGENLVSEGVKDTYLCHLSVEKILTEQSGAIKMQSDANINGVEVLQKPDVSDSDTDSYLEITIDAAVEEKINNYRITQLSTKKKNSAHENLNASCANNMALNNSPNNVEYLSTTSRNDSDSKIVESTQKSLVSFLENKIDIHQKNCAIVRTHSLKLSPHLTASKLVEHHGTKKYCTSEAILEWEAEVTRNTKLRISKGFSSFVPETSDEENALSDLEIIEDTPNYKSNLKTIFRESLACSVNNKKSMVPKLSSDEIDSELGCERLDFSDNSNSSYVFEIESEAEPGSTKCEETCIMNPALSSSDSDTNDFIEVTPLKTKFSSLTKIPEINSKVSTLEKEKTNCSSFTSEKVANESNNSGSFSSVNMPSPGVLEETLTKLMEKGDFSSTEISGGGLKKPQPSNCCQLTVFKERLKKLSSTDADDDFDSYNNPMKKLKADYEFQTDPKFWEIDENINTGMNNSKVCKSGPSRETKLTRSTNFETNYSKLLVPAMRIKTRRSKMSSRDADSNSNVEKQNRDKVLLDKGDECADKNIKTNSSAKKGNLITNRRVTRSMTNNLRQPTEKANDLINKLNLVQEDTKLQNQNYFENSCVNVAFTGLHSIHLENIIQELGGKKVNDLRSGQVLVTDQVRRTVKFLCAIGLCIPIASPEWLFNSQQNQMFLNPWNYILKCKESEEKWDFDLKQSLDTARRKKLLDGFKVFATESVKPPVEDILRIAECCGGVPLVLRPESWTKRTIVISCVDDKNSWPPKKFDYVKIVHYEFILIGVLRQSLDFETYSLR